MNLIDIFQKSVAVSSIFVITSGNFYKNKVFKAFGSIHATFISYLKLSEHQSCKYESFLLYNSSCPRNLMDLTGLFPNMICKLERLRYKFSI